MLQTQTIYKICRLFDDFFISGGIVRMEHRLPSGDVATGLAWAYVINYLKITLLGKG